MNKYMVRLDRTRQAKESKRKKTEQAWPSVSFAQHFGGSVCFGYLYPNKCLPFDLINQLNYLLYRIYFETTSNYCILQSAKSYISTYFYY